MNDLELLRLIRERRAELQRAELASLGLTMTDDLRGKALAALVQQAARGDPDAVERVQQCAKLLGPEFQAAFIEYAARQAEEEPGPEEGPEATHVSHEFPDAQNEIYRSQKDPRVSGGEDSPPSNAAHGPHYERNAQAFSHLPPVEPAQRELPWYEGAQPPGLRRSNEIKRRFLAQKPDRSVDAGSSWMKR
jgi:hypothetical protein